MKTIVTIISAKLVINSYLFLCITSVKQKQALNFQVVGSMERKIFLFFVYSDLCSTLEAAEFKRFLYK